MNRERFCWNALSAFADTDKSSQRERSGFAMKRTSDGVSALARLRATNDTESARTRFSLRPFPSRSANENWFSVKRIVISSLPRDRPDHWRIEWEIPRFRFASLGMTESFRCIPCTILFWSVDSQTSINRGMSRYFPMYVILSETTCSEESQMLEQGPLYPCI